MGSTPTSPTVGNFAHVRRKLMKVDHARKWKIHSRHTSWLEADKTRKGLIKKNKMVQGDTVKVHRFEKDFVVKTADITRAAAIAKVKNEQTK